jgi:hypothetical protein
MNERVRATFLRYGANLPTASRKLRGMLMLKQAAATEDIPYLGVVDSSDNPQTRRLLTETYADTLYAAIASEHDALTVVDGTGINFTLTDQQLTAEPIFAGTGAAGTVARSDHTHTNLGITVQEGDVSLDTDITTLDFDASDFNITESPENEANIALNYGTGTGQPAEGDHDHDSDYSQIGHEHQFMPKPARFPLGNIQDIDSAATILVSNSSYAAYMGRADAAYTSISLRVQVNTAASGITWAEVGIGTAPAITLNGGASITRRGSTNVAASFNSTGDKTVAVAVSGISAGDHLWALFGSQATTPYQLLSCEVESMDAGIDQSSAATRISTMSSPTSFGISAVRMPTGFWIGSV